MPVDPLILEKFSDDVDKLQDQLQDVARNLKNGLLDKLSDSVTETRNLVNAFGDGEDVTKKLSAQMSKMQKESNRLSLNSIKLQSDLTRAQSLGNRLAEAKIRKAIIANNLATQIIEKEQTLLNKIQQQVDAQQEASKAAKKQLLSALSFEKIMSSGIVKAVLAVDTQVTNLNKSLGISYESAKELRDGMESFATSANDGFTTVARLSKAQADLTEQLGIAVDFGDKERQQFAKLTELVGLSADEAGKLANFSAAAGMSTSDYLKDVRTAGFAAQQANKIHISDKQLLQSISKLSSGILVKFQGNPKALAEAVVQAKKFGTTLEQVDKTGESLLNFETSIENELKAELITGKQLNFERARAAALTGDQATLMQEVASQAGSLEEFSSMNVIAQNSLAEAFGKSREEMAEMLMKQETINKYGKEAGELNAQQLEDFEKSGMSLDAYLAKEAEKVSIQEKFNTAMERMQEMIGNIAAGPLGTMLKMFADILSSATGLYTIMGLMGTVSLIKMISGLTTALALKKLSTKESIKGATADIAGATAEVAGSAASIPGVGWLIAGGVAAALFGALMGYLAGAKTGDDVISPGYGKRTILSPEGAIKLNDNDTIVAGTNLGGGGKSNMDMTPLTAAINELRNAVNALANKPQPAMAIQVGAEKLGEVVGRQAETGTNQYKNAYRLA